MSRESRKRIPTRAVDADDEIGKLAKAVDRSSGVGCEHPVTLRLPEKLLEGVEELVPYIAGDMEFAALGRVSRSQVLRIAVLHGVNALRERYALTRDRSESG